MSATRKNTAPLLALFALLLGAFVWQCATLFAGSGGLLERTRQQELYTAQGLAGALLQAHPELEEELAAALRPESLAQHQPAGAQTLARYGYGRADSHNAGDAALQRGWSARLLGLVLSASGALLVLCALLWLDRRRWQQHLLLVLGQYLAEDYSFARSLESLFGWQTAAGGMLRQLDDALKRLGQAVQLKSLKLVEEQENTKSLVTDLSHQIKTPVASLKTCLDLVQEAEEEGERAEFLQRSHLQVDKLESLTAALMNVSRMEAAMIQLHPAPCSLQELLLQAVNAVYDRARAKGIAIELQPFEDLALRLDMRWTAEALMNVLDNAVKYSPPDTDIELSVEPLLSFVRVSVRDRGIGIPREEQQRIFQRFFRGSHPAVRSAEGAGVGLALTRTILERQGGGISVQSQEGAGSVFLIQLRR